MEESELERCIHEHERRVIGIAWRILGSSDQARDAAQEVFLKFDRAGGAALRYGRTGSWLYRVTINLCFDWVRKRSPDLELKPELAAVRSSADRDFEADHGRALLMQALARLPERERNAIVLREVEELSTAEVAAVMGVSEVTVRSQISTARVKLRQWLEGKV